MSYHQTYTGLTWEKLTDYNAELAYLNSVFIRLLGMMEIVLGILIIIIIFFIVMILSWIIIGKEISSK